MQAVVYAVRLAAQKMHTLVDSDLGKTEAVIGEAGLIVFLNIFPLENICIAGFRLAQVHLVYGLVRLHALAVAHYHLCPLGSAHAQLYPTCNVKAEIVGNGIYTGAVHLGGAHKIMLSDGGHYRGIGYPLGRILCAHGRREALVRHKVRRVPALNFQTGVIGFAVKDIVHDNGALGAQPCAVRRGKYCFLRAVLIGYKHGHFKAGIVIP